MTRPPVAVDCERMTSASRDDARALLAAFLEQDAHYRETALRYGDGGAAALVAKVDDVSIAHRWQSAGVGSAMLQQLAQALREAGVMRIDSSCHRDNRDAWRFYERLGFQALDEERIAWLL